MIKELKKATYQDLIEQSHNFNIGYFKDLDESFIYFTVYEWDDDYEYSSTKTFKYSYTWENSVLTVDKESKVEVIEDTSYVEMKKELSGIKSLLNKLFNKENVIKQFDDKTREVVEPLYIPFGKVDGHGDAYASEDGPKDLVKSFLEYKDSIQKAINHKHATKCFDIVTAWVTDKESTLGGVKVAKNQPLVKLKYTEKAYELRKAGKLLGPSIGCSAWTVDFIKSLKEEIKTNPKRFIVDFDFSEKRHHLSLTTPSVGGPASGEDWFIDLSNTSLEKNMKNPEDLALLEELGEEFTELEKSKAVDNQEKAPSTSDKEAKDAGVDNKTLTKGNEDAMSDISKAEFEALQAELAKMKAEKAADEVEKSLAKYELDEEVQKGLASVMVSLEDKTLVLKALDALESRVVELKSQKEELAKSMEGKEQKPTTELEKQFNEEVGEAAEDKKSSAEQTSESLLKQYRELDRKNK